jgi:putative ABC transport system permease protein
MNDLKFGFRQLCKTPGFTGIAILTLALGIGLNTSMFSLMNLLILKPLPYPQPNELVRLYRNTPQSSTASHSAPDFLELSRATADFASLGAFRGWGYTLMPPGRTSVNLNALRVTPGFLSVLGLKPAVGRWFTAAEDDPGNHVVILGYDVWQAQFGGDPAIVGTNVQIDGEATTVVGVMPADFTSIFLWGPTDVLRPMGLTAVEKASQVDTSLAIVARRHSGISLEEFNARLGTVAKNLAELRPKDRSQDGLRAATLDSLAHSPQMTILSWMMVGLGGFVLLIACANLANLQLARTISRSHEFAVRAALGASRGKLLRPQLAESMLLAVSGGLVGILVALWTNDWISSRLSANGIFKLTLQLDWRVLGFALGVSLMTGVLFGLVPALMLSRIRVTDSLKSGTRGNTGDRLQSRLQSGLIVTQFSNAVILLAGAAGFLAGADRLVTAHPGWDQQAIYQTVLNLPQARYATPEQTYGFYQHLQERLNTLPGVQSATVGWTLPVFLFLTTRTMVVEGQSPPAPGHEPLAYFNAVMPSYLPTIGVKLQSGRNFTEADKLGAVPVAIINESMARKLFPGGDALGHRIGSPDPKNPGWLEIVGVVPDIHMAVGAVPQATPFQVLRPLAQETWNYVAVAIRSDHPERLAEPMRQTIAALDPTLAPQQAGTIREVTKMVTGSATMMSTVLVGFSCLGLFLAALGLYGVIARVVVLRTPEIGVRVALGAQARDVVWLIIHSGLRLTLIGTGLGLAGAYALSWGLAKVIPNAEPLALLAFAAIAGVLIGVGVLACWLPARRAAKVDPIVALRAE